MKTIYKYQLDVEDDQSLALPQGAEILCIQVQRDKPCIWVLCDADAPLGPVRTILIRGTGHSAEDCIQSKYIGTFQIMGGNLVFHAFEK